MNVNTLPAETGPTLRQILAFQGIETSTLRQRQWDRARLDRKAAADRALSGIEVVYLDAEVIELTA